MAYEDTILVKLRRDYKHDEVVMYALNKIREQKVEIGKLKSYIDEVEENPVNEKLKEVVEIQKKQLCDLKSEFRKQLERPHESKALKQNKKLTVKNIELRAKNKLLSSQNASYRDKLFNILTNPDKFNKMTQEQKIKYLETFTNTEN